MVVAADRDLVAREVEIEQLRAFLPALAEGPAALVIQGEAGIGKTTLWRAGIEHAQAAGLTVLVTRCVEAELPLGFVGLSDLVQEGLPAAAEELADHERAALSVASGLEAPREAQPPIALPRAFRALLLALARRAPVLVAIDDVQWLDAPSARVVSFAARRLGVERIGLLLAQRGDGADPLGLAQSFGPERLDRLRLGPLPLGALARLVRSRFDVQIPRPVLARVHEASAGNPMFALEFARSLAGRERVHLEPLPVPESLEHLVRARVDGYPEEMRRLLAIVAAAGRPTLSLLAAVDAAAAQALDPALDAGAITVGDDAIIRFTHPLLASAVYGELAPSQRRELHARLARVSQDVEERGRHLALAQAKPDAIVAAVLDEAAVRAGERGAPEAAAELAQEAVRLTPPDDVAGRDERSISAAWYWGGAGQAEEGRQTLDLLLATGLSGPQRSRALLLRTWLENDVESGGRQIEEALEHVADDVPLRARLLLASCNYHWYRADLSASETAARQALAAAEEADDPELIVVALDAVADRADRAHRPEPALLERAIALADGHGTPPGYPSLRETTGRRLVRQGDLSGARGLLEAELAVARETGFSPDRYRLWRDLAEVELRAGNWELAERYIGDAWDFAEGDELWAAAEILERRSRLAALRGETDDARRLVKEGIACAEGIHWFHLAAVNRWVLGFLELSLDQPARAWHALEDVLGTPIWGRFEVLDALADAAEALVALDRLETAIDVVAKLSDEARTGHVWAKAAERRCVALLLTAQGDSEAAITAANEAARAFKAEGFALDCARALLAAGRALHRSGERRRAAAKLEEARVVFSELGAALWVARVDQELRRARPRPRRDGELTSAERRVAALVAAGHTNRETASQLFVTLATVEAHLTRIYRKVGVRSRTELARTVADGTLRLDD